ncbi:hypothetical protein M409DRAFT_30247 [Zasmidium cellare ATCC 36951]|uniref:Smr domain-containing protein n=1 Tax=Zasmidium cellare ATCC 36951 TaxID=1080233 RepID=A0A6A6BWQ3_ZASCE|nr:uncharacterized protein M409DRAFT_30247 [Zasmidium cellare ATCC 36951]KAF2159241.1 hypothetical protein M409DRAFT_30247 [Zasmidium cellare ATCC 36951]
MDDTFAKLEAEYCPPLDPALLSAILSDYDLNVEDQIQNARDILDPLKESALLEEEFGFDASGTGAQDEGLTSGTRSESFPGTSASVSRETELTSLSNGLSSLDLEHGESSPISSEGVTAEEIERLDEETKILLLQEVFHDRVSRHKVQYTLQKCNGKWHKAMEELLNHVYFNEGGEDGGTVPKGIDAFSEDHVVRRGRRKKGKGKNLAFIDERRSTSLPVSPTYAPTPPFNKWQTASQDIEFIATRTGLSNKAVTSIYYSSGTSLPKTIAGVLKDSIQKGKADLEDDPILAVNAHDLEVEFPTIATEYARTIVHLTHPSTAAAHELAKALTAQPEIARGGIQIIPSYARPVEAEDEFTQHAPKKDRAIAKLHIDADSSSSERAAAYSAARSTALSQAYAAHRKAKSDRLMGGAAAYYSQVGRDYAMLSSQASASAADELANSQSEASQLDLHGIDVLNGVRIAREKVGRWWEGLGESRANGRLGAQERQAGYSIVVGRGRHSEGGKSKLGPAVNRALREDGWRVEQDGATLVVKGRARR